MIFFSWAVGNDETHHEDYAHLNSSRFLFDSFVQTGIEYDSNVFKNFGSSAQDIVAKALLKSRGKILISKSFTMDLEYLGGGKKYISHEEQDTLIQFFSGVFTLQPLDKFRVSLSQDWKYQNERDSLDSNSQDINEDYYSMNTTLQFHRMLPKSFSVEANGTFTYFQFDPTENFSFFRESGLLTLSKQWTQTLLSGIQYMHSWQQFDASSREDQLQEVSLFFRRMSVPLISVKYAYQKNNSTVPTLCFSNHKLLIVLSFPLIRTMTVSTINDTGDNNKPEPSFVFHVMGLIQRKRFPSVFESTLEGQRSLLTGEEDDNFNSLILKLTYHPSTSLAVEAKYTRYSNELSSEQDAFDRSLWYSGIRLSF